MVGAFGFSAASTRAELLGQRQVRADLLADRAAAGDVHRVRHEVAAQRQQHRTGDVGARAVLRLGGRGAQVRGDDDVGQLEQRAGVVGSVTKTSIPAPPTWPDAHRVGQRLLVDQPTAGGVHDDHARLGLLQRLGVDQALGLRRLRQVDGDGVGAGQQLVQGDELDAQLRGARGRDVGVVGDQRGVEGGEALGEQLADLAEADHTDGLALELDAGERAALPLAAAQALVGGRDPAGDRQQQRDGVLGGRDDVGGRRVDHQHAALGGGGHLDVVQADPGARRRP